MGRLLILAIALGPFAPSLWAQEHGSTEASASESTAVPRAKAKAKAPKKFFSGRSWFSVACGGMISISDPDPVTGAMHLYTKFNGQKAGDLNSFCYEVGDNCDNATGWTKGDKNLSENNIENTSKSFALGDSKFTVLSFRNDRVSPPCVETLRIEQRGGKATIYTVDRDKERLPAGIPFDEGRPQQGGSSPQNAQTQTPPASQGMTYQQVLDLLNSSSVDSNRNGIADAFDGDFGRVGNMCNDYAVRACSTLGRYRIPCVVTWFYINNNVNDRHAIVRVLTNRGWYYVEPQLNRNFGMPLAGGVYHEFQLNI